jgi:uncharacterized membrane protein HdeD (DUF308 family)
MTAVAEQKKAQLPWWLILIQGILAIVVGILLFAYPVRAFITLSFFIGVWWFISGIFDIVMIFFDRRMWGWKLFMGIIGILAGSYLFNEVLRGAATLAYTTAILLGFMGVFYGFMGIIRAFQGAGWGAGILGAVSIVFGFYILANPLASTLAVPWIFGSLGILGGIAAIAMAFRVKP